MLDLFFVAMILVTIIALVIYLVDSLHKKDVWLAFFAMILGILLCMEIAVWRHLAVLGVKFHL